MDKGLTIKKSYSLNLIVGIAIKYVPIGIKINLDAIEFKITGLELIPNHNWEFK